MERICQQEAGLFPAPAEIEFSCSCPDWASMCKHVAAVLYGVGARLDEQPELLFKLRKVDEKDLIARAGADHQPRILHRLRQRAVEVGLIQAFPFVLIADHTKTGKNAVVQVCGLDAVDLFITDDGLPGRERTALAEKGVRLELV